MSASKPLRSLLPLTLSLWAGLAASGCAREQATVAPDHAATPVPSASTAAPHGQLFEELVVFADFHDPAIIELSDGRRYGFELPPGQTEYPGWKAGQKLRLIFRDDAGAFIEVAGSGLSFRVLTWPTDGHPIDLDLVRQIETNDTTAGRIEAHDLAARRWTAEVERAYRAWEITPDLSPDARAAILRSSRQWHSFADAYAQALSATLKSREGTFWHARPAEEIAQLHRDHATRIWSLLHF